jgi:LacI family transcriptional regulator, fructose operon transcriptional repressor
LQSLEKGDSLASIKDVAREAGVSIATVSRALSNKRNVRPELRSKILQVAEALSYQPNRVASSLRTQTSGVIGLLVSDIRNPFFTDIARAIEDVAHQNKMSLFLCNTDEDPQKELHYLNTLLAERVAGIILSPTPNNAEQIKFILDDGIPVVTIDRRLKDAKVDCVLSDNIDTARMITNHLIERGYRRIGALIGLSAITTGHERMQGYQQSMEAHGLDILAEFIMPMEQDAEAVVNRWLTSDNPPDAIFAGNNRMTAGAINAIKQAGLSVPDDIAVAGFDETVWMPHIGPGITVISQPTYEMGRTAMDLLLQRLSQPHRPTREIILRGALIERGSTQPA